MTPALRVRHLTLLALGLLGLTFLFAGCDSDGLGHDGPTGPVGPPGPPGEVDVRVVTFTLNDRDSNDDFLFARTYSDSRDEVQYETDDSFFPELRTVLTRRAVDDGLVMLYVSDVLNEDGLRRNGWTALPLTLGFDEATEQAPNGDGFVDYVLATTFTFNVGELYVNLVASDVATIDFLEDTQGLLTELEDVRFRLVAIPGSARGLDVTDYEAVKQAFDLPD